MQSPIAVDKESSIVRNYTPFFFTDYDKEYDAVISYTEHAIQIDFWQDHNLPTVSGGGLYKEYVLMAMDFHWDAEHILDDKSYALECQLTHYAKKYGDIANAMNYKDGLAIMSTFYTISKIRNPAIGKLIDSIPPGDKKIDHQVELLKPLTPQEFLPSSLNKFYRYNGSITKPCYDQTVIWTLFSKPSTVTRPQLAELVSKWEMIFKNVPSTCREVQNDSGRRVFLSAI